METDEFLGETCVFAFVVPRPFEQVVPPGDLGAEMGVLGSGAFGNPEKVRKQWKPKQHL